MIILVVDDELVSRRMTGGIIRKHNFEVVELNDGRAAVDYLQQHGAVDLIVSDVMMPDLDGFDMLRFLKTDSRFKNIPVILVTGLNDLESVTQGIELGARDYVTKPVSGAILIAKIDRVLASRRPQVVVVEDDPALRDAITQIVERAGYTVLDVASAEEALTILGNHQVSALISDVCLPGMTGVQLLRAVKYRFSSLPVILMTGCHEGQTVRDVVLAGADGFIAKPFHNIEVITKLQALVGNTPGVGSRR